MFLLILLAIYLPFVAASSINEVATAERQLFERYHALHDAVIAASEAVYPFGSAPCPLLEKSPLPPRSVHQLRPEDVEIVAAIGDSLTASRATLAQNIHDLDVEYRGRSFITGNDEELTEMASIYNILKSFRGGAALSGGSKGQNVAHDDYTDDWGLNLAISGAVASDVFEQAQTLVAHLQKHPRADEAWKFVNLFIGSNDLCKICTNFTRFGVDAFQTHLNNTITYLRDHLPRTYLNVMLPIHIQFLVETHPYDQFCTDFHTVTCPCIQKLSHDDFSKIKQSFDDSLSIFYGDAYQTDTFAVSISAVSGLTEMPKTKKNQPNFAILALDCFHFSRAMHDAVAKVVWRNLLEPVHNRTTFPVHSFEESQIVCPTEHCPYLRTLRNSANCHRAAEYRNLQVEPETMLVDKATQREAGFPFLALGLIGSIASLMMISLAVFAAILSRRKKSVKSTERTPLLRSTIFSDEENPF
ncbi:unnamed protein product, partial [Mesorhabditis spiculigera]